MVQCITANVEFIKSGDMPISIANSSALTFPWSINYTIKISKEVK
jgi:hypothetical protein